MPSNSSKQNVGTWKLRRRCRHQFLAEVFDADSSSCGGMCDLCRSQCETEKCDVTDISRHLMNVIQRHVINGQRLTGNQLVKLTNHKEYDVTRQEVENVIIYLLRRGYFKVKCHIHVVKNISYIYPGPNSRLLRFQRVVIPKLKNDKHEDAFEEIFSV